MRIEAASLQKLQSLLFISLRHPFQGRRRPSLSSYQIKVNVESHFCPRPRCIHILRDSNAPTQAPILNSDTSCHPPFLCSSFGLYYIHIWSLVIGVLSTLPALLKLLHGMVLTDQAHSLAYIIFTTPFRRSHTSPFGSCFPFRFKPLILDVLGFQMDTNLFHQ